MIERRRGKRFDDVFQIMVIIEAILLEFMWTFLVGGGRALQFVTIYVSALLLWALGHLLGDIHEGIHEYPLKVAGFQGSLFVLFGFLSLFFGYEVLPVGVGIFLAIIGLLPSVGIVFYLKESINRNLAFLLLLCITIGEIVGVIITN